MKFNLEIDSENIAVSTRADLVDIINVVTSQIKRGDSGRKILDINGNSIGKWSLEMTEGDDESDC